MTTRRLFATLTVAAGLALSVAVPGSAANAMVPPEEESVAIPSHHAARPGPAQHRHQVAVACAATRKFHSAARARNHGYALFRDQDGIACIAMGHTGAMGRHLVNGDAVGNPRVNLPKPEALVYAGGKGHRRLVALEYLVLRQDWRKVHGAHAPRPRLFGQRFDLTRAGNRYGLPPFYSLHAWIWRHNPAGDFAMWNPDVHCPCAH
jgi:hypothetical protein